MSNSSLTLKGIEEHLSIVIADLANLSEYIRSKDDPKSQIYHEYNNLKVVCEAVIACSTVRDNLRKRFYILD